MSRKGLKIFKTMNKCVFNTKILSKGMKNEIDLAITDFDTDLVFLRLNHEENIETLRIIKNYHRGKSELNKI